MFKNYDNIIVSPHPDDAVLSLAGTIGHFLRNNERCLVVNIFNGRFEGNEALSEIAMKYLKEDLNVQTVSLSDAYNLQKIRMKEDYSALCYIGVESQNLNYKDAIYRGNPPYYPTEKHLFSNLNVNEYGLINNIVSSLRRFSTSRKIQYLFPLGVGNHIDHRIAFEVGFQMHQMGKSIIFYEEVPYSLDFTEVKNKIQEINLDLKCEYIDITSFKKKKIEAIKLYKSQIKGLFEDIDNIPCVIEQCHLDVSNDSETYYERLWKIK
ncbi:PIG-L family deacetylase [Bacillus cereus]|nr:PIG-L family deacetylase [Bacillus cereus]